MLSDYVSVIMSTINPLQDYTQKALAHLQRSSYPYELILLNRTREWATGTVVNQGIHASVGDHIAFLCDDCFIEPGALHAMVEVLKDKEVGIVGAFLRYPNGEIQHAGGAFRVVLNEGKVGVQSIQIIHIGNNSPLLEVKENYDFVTGACMMTRRDVIEDIGGYDPDCQIAWGDVDFCFRAREAGYRVALAENAHAIHQEATTRRKLDTRGVEMEDLKWFLQKWSRSGYMQYQDKGDQRVFSVGDTSVLEEEALVS